MYIVNNDQKRNMTLEEIDIEIGEIKDKKIQNLMIFLFNKIEEMSKTEADLKEENQKLKDENSLLKGEKPKPNIKPKNKDKGDGDISSEKDRREPQKKERKKRIPKKESVKIDRTEECKIDPSKLPSDVEFKGYENIVIQDIEIRTNNVEYKREIYYSPSQNKRFIADIPIQYEGEFGPQIKSLALIMKHACNMSEPKILEFVTNFGISTSKSSISRMLLDKNEDFSREKEDIFRAGLESSSYQQTDDTGARVNGENHYTHIFCNNLFTAFFTKKHKNRLTLLDILSGKEEEKREYCLNEEALQLLTKMRMTKKILKELEPLQKETVFGANYMEKIIQTHCPKIGTQQKKRLLEATAIAAYHKRTDIPVVKKLICDDAPQFKFLTEYLGLCWVHDGRHYKKLRPVIPYHKKLLDEFLTEYWQFYKELLKYKKNPSKESSEKLSKDFDVLFSKRTDYNDLDDRIAKTKAKKEELLLVLIFSEVPLHNNAAELAARVQVRNRDVSLHTMTRRGTQMVDTFMTIVQTAKNLGVNVYEYILDRVSKIYNLTSLADVIRQHSTVLP